jgi:hypothetical protein
LDAALFAVEVAEDGPVVAEPPVAWASEVDEPPWPPWLIDVDPESALLSEVDVVGPTRTLLSMGPTELPPLIRFWLALELAFDAELEPTDAGAVPAFWSPTVDCCAIAAKGEKVSAATQAAVIRRRVFISKPHRKVERNEGEPKLPPA